MHILIAGATGGLGGAALEEALARGHTVTALARDPARLGGERQGVAVLRGDVRDRASLAAALPGHDAVLSCIGARGDELSLLSEGLSNLIDAATHAGVLRLIAVGGAGVLQHDEESLRSAQPDFPTMLRPVSAAHWQSFERLRASGMRWTFVCPPMMTREAGTGSYRAERDYFPEGGAPIAYADVALLLLDELESNAFIGARVGVAQ